MFVVGSSLKETSHNFSLFVRHISIKLLNVTNYHLDLSFCVYQFPRQALSTNFTELLNTDTLDCRYIADTLDFKTVFTSSFGPVTKEIYFTAQLIINVRISFYESNIFKFKKLLELYDNYLGSDTRVIFQVNHGDKIW